MVQLAEVAELVDDDVVEHLERGEQQPPVERDRASRRGRAPSRALVADAQPLDLDSQGLALAEDDRGGDSAGLLAIPALDRGLGGPAHEEHWVVTVGAELRERASAGKPAERDRLPEPPDDTGAPQAEGRRLLPLSRERSLDPVALLRGEAVDRRTRRARRYRQQHLAVAHVQAETPLAPVLADGNLDPACCAGQKERLAVASHDPATVPARPAGIRRRALGATRPCARPARAPARVASHRRAPPPPPRASPPARRRRPRRRRARATRRVGARQTHARAPPR